MRKISGIARVASLVVLCVLATGCRFKAYESYRSAQIKEIYTPTYRDPYTYGGFAESSGGLLTNRTYYLSDTVFPAVVQEGPAAMFPDIRMPSEEHAPAEGATEGAAGAH